MTQDTPAALAEAEAFASTNSTPESALNRHWFRKGYEYGAQAATSAAPRCAHGILKPHECRECANGPSDQAIAAWMSERAATSAAGGATGETREELLARIDDLQQQIEEEKRGPWPEWAEKVLAVIRRHSGYDGYDDMSEGIDLAAELDELLEDMGRSDTAALAAQSPDSGAGPAEIVMAALETGEWHLQRHLPHSCFTAAANKEQAWSVKREAAPFCSEDDSRIWTGPTALAALQKACDALKLPLPAAAALAQQGAQNG